MNDISTYQATTTSNNEVVVFFDTETATTSPTSLCQIACVAMSVITGEILWSHDSLVRPPDNEYFPFNTELHGISPAMTENEQAFPAVWEKIKEKMQSMPVVAHNVSFDAAVLRGCAKHYNMTISTGPLFCTYWLSMHTWPNLGKYTLAHLSTHVKHSLTKAHDAFHDVRALAAIGIQMCADGEYKDFADLAAAYDCTPGNIKHNNYLPFHSPKWKSSKAFAPHRILTGVLNNGIFMEDISTGMQANEI